MTRARGTLARAALVGAAFALVLVTGSGRAFAQAPSAPPASLERAAALVRARAFVPAAAMLRKLLETDPANRAAQEMLAFALESSGDLAGERKVRSALAARFPEDAQVQADYGRVLERSGEDGAALRAYRRARAASAGQAAAELDAAIQRMAGRTAVELEAPLALTSDPAATASSMRAGVAFPIGAGDHVSLLATRWRAEDRVGAGATESGALAASFVRQGSAASFSAGPMLHAASPRGGSHNNVSFGGAVAARAVLSPTFEADGRGGIAVPWDEAAIALLDGGRATAAEGHLYAHALSGRLLLEAGGRARRLSILALPDSAGRPHADQQLWIGGADFVVWRKPGAAVQGEMFDESLTSPAPLSPALTLAYRHYDVATQTTPGFAARIGLVPRARVDETSAAATLVSKGGRWGLVMQAGFAVDAARADQSWRGGGTLVWAPAPATRVSVGYQQATELAAGLLGKRRDGNVSVHVDL